MSETRIVKAHAARKSMRLGKSFEEHPIVTAWLLSWAFIAISVLFIYGVG